VRDKVAVAVLGYRAWTMVAAEHAFPITETLYGLAL
jgi:hypothetical protein